MKKELFISLALIGFLVSMCMAQSSNTMPHTRRHQPMPHSQATKYRSQSKSLLRRNTRALPHQRIQKGSSSLGRNSMPHWNMHRNIRPGQTKGGSPLYEVKNLPHWAKHRKEFALTKNGEKIYMMVDLPHWAKHRKLLYFTKDNKPVYVAIPMPHHGGRVKKASFFRNGAKGTDFGNDWLDEILEETDLPIVKVGPGAYRLLEDALPDDFRQRFIYKVANVGEEVYLYMDLPHWARHRKLFRATKGNKLVWAVVDMPHHAKHRTELGLTKGGFRRWEAAGMPHHARHRSRNLTKGAEGWTSRSLPHWARHRKEASVKETEEFINRLMPHHARHGFNRGNRSSFSRKHNAMPHSASHHRDDE